MPRSTSPLFTTSTPPYIKPWQSTISVFNPQSSDATEPTTMRHTPSLHLSILLLLAALLPSTHAHDPCGPAIQGASLPNNTCNRTIDLVTAPAVYGALLLNDGTGVHVAWYNCAPVVFDACAAIHSPDTPVGVWNWTDPGSECVMGFWLPAYNGSAPRPTYDDCMNNILGPMYNIGLNYGGTAYNQVTVNVRTLPDNNQNGSQVDVGYPSYTITYLPLIQGPSTPLT